MSLQLPEALDVQVRAMAATLGVTRTEIIRRAVQHELETEHLDLTGPPPVIYTVAVEEDALGEEPEGVPG